MTRAPVASLIVLTTLRFVAPVPARTQPVPTLADLLRRGAAYEDAYAAKVSGTTLDELFVLIELNGGAMTVPQRIESDIVLVRINVNGQVLGLRDPYAVDTKPVRERQPRIIQALSPPSLASWEAVQGFVREHAIFFRSNVVVWFSDPMQALQFVTTTNQPRMTYKLEGRKKLNGVEVYGVSFKEQEWPDTTYLLNTPGNPVSSGRFWIDPSTGAIHETELWVQSELDTARIQVTFAPDAKLGMLLPHEASHTFETRELGSGGVVGTAASRASFESTATYTHPRYTPVDLARIAK